MNSYENEFLEKIENHKPVIFKISKMYMDNFNDQKDLFQEITFQAWKAYPQFEARSKFSTWLYRVALNTAITFLKNKKKRGFIRNDETEKYKLADEEYNDDSDKKLKIMYHAIHQLNEIDKALIFYYLEGLSGKEIAQQLGISEVNVRVKMNRAKEKLKQFIEKIPKESSL